MPWAWDKDPIDDGKVIKVALPRIGEAPFPFFFAPPDLAPDRNPATASFRYWHAASTLRRGADFWAPAVQPQEHWFFQGPLTVRLDVSNRWNSSYDRRALNFDHGVLPSGELVYASNSADILCHELGHAILDIVQPMLWHSGNYQEAVAFRESFADVSALLCALQVPRLRNSVWPGAGEVFFRDSRLSRLAAQFGSGLKQVAPADADRVCLRNAYNSFRYAPPVDLPVGVEHAAAVASDVVALTSRPHSFSRVFTGAMFEALGGMLAVRAPATANGLLAVTSDLRDIIVAAVKSAPIVPEYYASVATKILVEARALDESYGIVFGDIFVERLILPRATVDNILNLPLPQPDEGFAGEVAVNLTPLELDGYGLAEPLYVAIPVAPDEPVASGAGGDGGPLRSTPPKQAAWEFVDQLFADGLVDYGDVEVRDHGANEYRRQQPSGRLTHRIERIDEQLRLRRI